MFSENILLREAEDGWVDVVNVVIMILWFAVFLKHGVSEFSRVLLSPRFVDIYGVTEQRNPEITLEQELER